MLHALLLAASLVPVHGVVLAPVSPHEAVVSTEAVTATVPEATRRYRLEPAAGLTTGTGIDAYLDRSTRPWTLRDVIPAGPFSPGVPDPARVLAIELGSPLPDLEFVDQDGKLVRLARAYAGKTVLVSFVFTRCPDRTLCPAISGKYAYLQSHLDPAKFALVEITLDPQYDSPAILKQYAAQFGADPKMWTLLTGKGSTIQHALNAFRIDSLRVSTANYLHSDHLFIVGPDGKTADIIDTGGWDPEGVIAEARQVSGLTSNPFERFKLSLIADVIAWCGGSQLAGGIIIDVGSFLLVACGVIGGLWLFGRIIWGKKKAAG